MGVALLLPPLLPVAVVSCVRWVAAVVRRPCAAQVTGALAKILCVGECGVAAAVVFLIPGTLP